MSIENPLAAQAYLTQQNSETSPVPHEEELLPLNLDVNLTPLSDNEEYPEQPEQPEQPSGWRRVARILTPFAVALAACGSPSESTQVPPTAVGEVDTTPTPKATPTVEATATTEPSLADLTDEEIVEVIRETPFVLTDNITDTTAITVAQRFGVTEPFTDTVDELTADGDNYFSDINPDLSPEENTANIEQLISLAQNQVEEGNMNPDSQIVHIEYSNEATDSEQMLPAGDRLLLIVEGENGEVTVWENGAIVASGKESAAWIQKQDDNEEGTIGYIADIGAGTFQDGKGSGTPATTPTVETRPTIELATPTAEVAGEKEFTAYKFENMPEMAGFGGVEISGLKTDTGEEIKLLEGDKGLMNFYQLIFESIAGQDPRFETAEQVKEYLIANDYTIDGIRTPVEDEEAKKNPLHQKYPFTVFKPSDDAKTIDFKKPIIIQQGIPVGNGDLKYRVDVPSNEKGTLTESNISTGVSSVDNQVVFSINNVKWQKGKTEYNAGGRFVHLLAIMSLFGDKEKTQELHETYSGGVGAFYLEKVYDPANLKGMPIDYSLYEWTDQNGNFQFLFGTEQYK